jgi:hypothetical protein
MILSARRRAAAGRRRALARCGPAPYPRSHPARGPRRAPTGVVA